MTSTNFSFLAKGHDPLFLQRAEAAERTLAVDPNTTLLKLRQLGEAFARHAAAGVWSGPQVDLLRELDRKCDLNRQVLDFFHSSVLLDHIRAKREASQPVKSKRGASTSAPAKARPCRRAP